MSILKPIMLLALGIGGGLAISPTVTFAAPAAAHTCPAGAVYTSAEAGNVEMPTASEPGMMEGAIVDDSLYADTAAWVAASNPSAGTPDGSSYPHMLGFMDDEEGSATFTFAACLDEYEYDIYHDPVIGFIALFGAGLIWLLYWLVPLPEAPERKALTEEALMNPLFGK